MEYESEEEFVKKKIAKESKMIKWDEKWRENVEIKNAK